MSLSTSKHYLHIVYVYPRLHLCSFATPPPPRITHRTRKKNNNNSIDSKPFFHVVQVAHTRTPLLKRISHAKWRICVYSSIYIYIQCICILYRLFNTKMRLYTRIYIQRRKQTPHHSAEMPSLPPPYAIWCGYLLMIHERTMETVRVVCMHYYIRYICCCCCFFFVFVVASKA